MIREPLQHVIILLETAFSFKPIQYPLPTLQVASANFYVLPLFKCPKFGTGNSEVALPLGVSGVARG